MTLKNGPIGEDGLIMLAAAGAISLGPTLSPSADRPIGANDTSANGIDINGPSRTSLSLNSRSLDGVAANNTSVHDTSGHNPTGRRFGGGAGFGFDAVEAAQIELPAGPAEDGLDAEKTELIALPAVQRR